MSTIQKAYATSSSLSAAVVTAMAMFSSTGFAQQTSTGGIAPAAGSPATTGQSDQLEEIVITAQKRVERLEDVPVAATVISSQALANANVADLSDLNNMVPSVQLNGTINGRVPTGIRGISSVSNEQTVGISSGVAVMIDGVPVPSDSFSANNVMGVQNVEVLLGPQSTLGGRTAASGVINLTTRGPTDTLQGFANSTVTTDGGYRLEGFLSGPIANRVEGSLNAYKTTTPYPITNLTLDRNTTQDVSGARAKLKVAVTDNLDVTLMAREENTIGEGFNYTYVYITPGNDLLFTPGPFNQQLLLPGITPSWKNLTYASPVTAAGGSHRDNDYSATIEERLEGGYTLTSTTAYTQEKQHQVQDLFAVNEFFWNVLTGQTVFYNTQSQSTTVQQTSEELKIVSPIDQTVSWLAGAFYSRDKIDEVYIRTLPPAGLDDHVIPVTSTYDAYARATWKLTPAMSLVSGLRFNHDVIGYDYDQFVTAGASAQASSGSASNNTLVGDINLKRQFAPDSMGYVSYSRGYSPAAYNTSAVLTDNLSMAPVSRENIDSFEVGTKGTYLNRTLSFNADIFYTIYSDYQIQSYAYAPGVLTPPLTLSSVGKAETRGLELDADWLATPTTRLSVNGAFVQAKFTDYKGAPCYGLQTTVDVTAGATVPNGQCAQPVTTVGGVTTDSGSPYQNVSGDIMPNSPKFKGTLAIEHRVPLANQPYQWVFGANYVYRTSAQMLPDQNPHAVQRAFGLLNLSTAFQSSDGRFSAMLFVKNVTNHAYYTDIEDFWSGPWNGNAVIGQPARDAKRYGGITLSASF